MNELRLSACGTGSIVTIKVAGDVDLATKPRLIDFLAVVVHDDDQRVSLDVTALAFIDAEAWQCWSDCGPGPADRAPAWY